MHERDFWNRDLHDRARWSGDFLDAHGEAVELIARGQRILARELADAARRLWRDPRRGFAAAPRPPDLDRR